MLQTSNVKAAFVRIFGPVLRLCAAPLVQYIQLPGLGGWPGGPRPRYRSPLFNLGDFYMKKTLVALAALAATGAFAQVTITGKLGVSMQKTSGVTTTAASQGLRVTDGDVVFAATEDLGGGYKATASSAVLLRGRETTVSGRDATLTLVTPAGAIWGGAVEAGPMIANAYAGAPVSFADGPDGIVLDGYNNLDVIGYKVPMGAMTLGLSHFEVNSSSAGAVSNAVTGGAAPGTGGNVGVVGAAGSASAGVQVTPVNGKSISVAYAAGALAVDADYTVYSANTNLMAGEAVDGLTRIRLAGTYDLGSVKVGLGAQTKTKSFATQYAFGVSAPMGALTVGLTYTARAAQDAVARPVGAGGNQTAQADARNAITLGMNYALSKTTNFYAGYASYSGFTTSTNNVATNDNEYRIRLLKSF